MKLNEVVSVICDECKEMVFSYKEVMDKKICLSCWSKKIK